MCQYPARKIYDMTHIIYEKDVSIPQDGANRAKTRHLHTHFVSGAVPGGVLRLASVESHAGYFRGAEEAGRQPVQERNLGGADATGNVGYQIAAGVAA